MSDIYPDDDKLLDQEIDEPDDEEPDDDEGEWRDCEEDLDYDGSPLIFAGPTTALRASTPDDPPIQPCPGCGVKCMTLKNLRLGYQCDPCADRAERGGY